MFSSQTEVVSSSVGTDKNIINESLPEQSRCSRKGQMRIFFSFSFSFFAMTWLIPNNTFSQLHAVFNLLPFATEKVRAAAKGSIWHLVGNKKNGFTVQTFDRNSTFLSGWCIYWGVLHRLSMWLLDHSFCFFITGFIFLVIYLCIRWNCQALANSECRTQVRGPGKTERSRVHELT